MESMSLIHTYVGTWHDSATYRHTHVCMYPLILYIHIWYFVQYSITLYVYCTVTLSMQHARIMHTVSHSYSYVLGAYKGRFDSTLCSRTRCRGELTLRRLSLSVVTSNGSCARDDCIQNERESEEDRVLCVDAWAVGRDTNVCQMFKSWQVTSVFRLPG